MSAEQSRRAERHGARHGSARLRAASATECTPHHAPSATLRLRAASATASALLATGLLLAGCGPIPPLAPAALPATEIPHVEPTVDVNGVNTTDGFTPQQHTAVRLRVTDCQGWGNGTGFVLDENHIITNRHVVEGATHIEVTTYDGKDYIATSSQVAPLADLAIVTLEPVFTEFVTFSDDTLERGDPVQIVGYPEGQALHVEDGFYESDELDDVGDSGEQVQVFNAHTLPGNSGSAIFDENGEVISILFASDLDRASIGWPVAWLQELLADPSMWESNPASC